MSFSATRGPADTISGEPPWWRRIATALREQWIFAALLGLVWCGDVLVMIEAGGPTVALMPGTIVLALLALSARRHPVLCGLGAAAVLGLNTILVWSTHMHSAGWLGIDGIRPSENAAGLLLVLYLFRARSLRWWLPATAVLAMSCVAAVFVRGGYSVAHPPMFLSRTLGIGFVELVLAAGTGTYLRGASIRDSAFRTLFRRQWPVIATLFILTCLELLSRNYHFPDAVVVLFGALAMSALAILAPTLPVAAAVSGALTLCLLAVGMRLTGIESDLPALGTIPIPCAAAGMFLMGFATRYADSRRAAGSGASLVGSALFALVVIPANPNHQATSETVGVLLLGGLLLIASVGAGMYFRTRDDERARSVQAEIADAQQRERMALARELHDIVAHHVTGIVVQAQAAQLVAGKNSQAATEALERIAGTGTEALAAMRRLVASMRSAGPVPASETAERATTDLTADLHVVVEQAGRVVPEHGRSPEITLFVDLERAVPQEVARSVLRVVQESLTNASKHAVEARHIEVRVRSTATHLHARITDDGTSVHDRPPAGPCRYGLVGMRERVALLGGQFSAGPGEHTGWYVEVWLPLRAQGREKEYR